MKKHYLSGSIDQDGRIRRKGEIARVLAEESDVLERAGGTAEKAGGEGTEGGGIGEGKAKGIDETTGTPSEDNPTGPHSTPLLESASAQTTMALVKRLSQSRAPDMESALSHYWAVSNMSVIYVAMMKTLKYQMTKIHSKRKSDSTSPSGFN
jgi:hypothetical protein